MDFKLHLMNMKYPTCEQWQESGFFMQALRQYGSWDLHEVLQFTADPELETLIYGEKISLFVNSILLLCNYCRVMSQAGRCPGLWIFTANTVHLSVPDGWPVPEPPFTGPRQPTNTPNRYRSLTISHAVLRLEAYNVSSIFLFAWYHILLIWHHSASLHHSVRDSNRHTARLKMP